MKFLDLEPTDENVIKEFCNDSIGRNIDVLQFITLINSIEENCSISIDALWGSGKTFFVKQVKIVLDAFNEHIVSLPSETISQIKDAWGHIRTNSTPNLQPQVCVYYDAWENDNDEDPILSLVHSIVQETHSNFNFNRDRSLLDIISCLAEVISGRQIKKLVDSMKSDNYLDTISESKDIRTLIGEFLDSLLPEKGNRLVIFIDELDRCKPDFAVRLLERIKHYFSNDKITFVFSINSHQLLHTIKRHYGEGFDASRYLDRFFDLSIELPPADMRMFYNNIGLSSDRWIYENVCKELANSFNMQMREITHFYNLAKIAAYRPTHDTRNDACFSEEKGAAFCTMLLTPFLIALKMSDRESYNRFITGNDGHEIHRIIKSTGIATKYINWLLSDDETFKKFGNADTRNLVDIQDRANKVYYAIFQYDYSSEYEYCVGQMAFTKTSKNDLLKTISALSIYADYS